MKQITITKPVDCLLTVPLDSMSQKNIRIYVSVPKLPKSPTCITLPLVKLSPGFSESVLEGQKH